MVSRLTLPEPARRAANLDSDRAADIYGVTGELSVLTPYGVTQAWARVLNAAGFEGVRGRLRFSVSHTRGLALFGQAGAKPDWPADDHPEEALKIAARMKIAVIDPPDDDDVTVVRP